MSNDTDFINDKEEKEELLDKIFKERVINTDELDKVYKYFSNDKKYIVIICSNCKSKNEQIGCDVINSEYLRNDEFVNFIFECKVCGLKEEFNLSYLYSLVYKDEH